MTHDVRRLMEDNHVELRALRLRALAEEPTAFGSTHAREEAFPESEWRSRLRPDGNPHYGGFDGTGALVGLCVGALDPVDPHVADLLAMWVDPPSRGTGLAADLVRSVITWASQQGCRTIRLHVTDGNARAEALYRRLGFTRTGRTAVRGRDAALEIEMGSLVQPSETGNPTVIPPPDQFYTGLVATAYGPLRGA